MLRFACENTPCGLFHPGTILHDGAAIVRGDRIIAAGCLLPLTDNPAVSSAIHTRHRAAIGVTERSDAIVVVVSEETGAISLAEGGSRRKPARFTAAVLSHVVRRGRIRLHGWTAAASAFGDLDLDLRDATIDKRQTAVTVLAGFGNVDVYVPEGVNVDVGGLALFGHRRDWGRDGGHPDAPTVHVRAFSVFGTVDVWRVPRDMRGGYGEIFRQLEARQRQLPS